MEPSLPPGEITSLDSPVREERKSPISTGSKGGFFGNGNSNGASSSSHRRKGGSEFEEVTNASDDSGGENDAEAAARSAQTRSAIYGDDKPVTAKHAPLGRTGTEMAFEVGG